MNELFFQEQLGIKLPTPEVDISAFFENNKVFMKRDDLIHPIISGNKWRKLKYHLHQAEFKKKKHLITVGGAFSNHLIAVAAAAQSLNLSSTGIIRGEEVDFNNPTLKEAIKMGMRCIPIDRETYKNRHQDDFKNYWLQQIDQSYWIPEGGSGYLGIQGCVALSKEISPKTEIIVCAAGTGTTATGILLGLQAHQKLWVIPALKGTFMEDEIKKWLYWSLGDRETTLEYLNKLNIWNGYARKGFAKIDDELVSFVQDFYAHTNIQLDLIYTGKAMLALVDRLSKENVNPHSQITFIHTGGLQGNKGYEEKLNFKLFSKS